MRHPLLLVLAGLIVPLLTPPCARGEGFRNVGYAGANFLQIAVDPVGAALGNSAIAYSDGVIGLYWNPSAIARSTGTEVTASTVDWIIDTRVSYLGVAHALPFGSIGASITALTMDDMEITTEYQPEGTGEYFGAGSYAVALTYATNVIERFSVGVSVKYVYEYIWETNGSTVAFDLGSLYVTEFNNLRIGMRIANFGGGVTFSGTPIDTKPQDIAATGISFPNDPRLDRVNEEYALPQSFSFGIAIDPYATESGRLTLLTAVNDPSDNVTQVVFGAEYAFQDLVYLRGGYKSGYDEESYTLGLGLRVRIGDVATMFDYAYSALGTLGSANLIGIRAAF